MDIGKRSKSYEQGYRSAWNDAITFLHTMAKQMNDPHAKLVLDLAAFRIGNRKNSERSSILEQEPQQ